jgi:serine protease Do
MSASCQVSVGSHLRALALVLSLSAASLATGALPETLERVKASVVAVGTFQKTRSPAFAFRGTGFVVGDGTIVATNAHVLPDVLQPDAVEMMAILARSPGAAEAEPRAVKTIAIDRLHDLALLKVSGAPLAPLKLGNSEAVREGEIYAFTGFPIGNLLGFVPVTHRGMIASLTPIAQPSATAQQLDERVIRRIQNGAFRVFQLDATAYPGNSGSPVFDQETGQVVGIINMVFVKGTKEAALSQPSGISFAIPATYLRELLEQ